MLVLTGTLRQFGEVAFDDGKKKMLKLWLEHETPRDNGPSDLKIEELILPMDSLDPESIKNLKQGATASVMVRAWTKGRDIAFQAVQLLKVPLMSPNVSESK